MFLSLCIVCTFMPLSHGPTAQIPLGASPLFSLCVARRLPACPLFRPFFHEYRPTIDPVSLGDSSDSPERLDAPPVPCPYRQFQTEIYAFRYTFLRRSASVPIRRWQIPEGRILDVRRSSTLTVTLVVLGPPEETITFCISSVVVPFFFATTARQSTNCLYVILRSFFMICDLYVYRRNG